MTASPWWALAPSNASKRASRTGLNPRTGEKIEIAAANVPKFTPGAAFKDAANKAQ